VGAWRGETTGGREGTDLVQADDVGVAEQLERGDLPAYLVADALGEDPGAVQDLDGEERARAAVPRLLHLAEVALPDRPPQLVRAQQRRAAAAAHHYIIIYICKPGGWTAARSRTAAACHAPAGNLAEIPAPLVGSGGGCLV